MQVNQPFESLGIENPLHRATVRMLRLLPQSLGELGCRAYLRMLRSRGSRIRAQTYFGCRMQCDPRDYVQSFILLFGVWEPEISLAIESALQPGDTFLDIGANVGYDALLGAMRVGPEGRVIAVEASRKTSEILKSNIDLNRLDQRISVVRVAASDRRGTLNLFEVSPSNTGAATTLEDRGGTLLESVEALPLHEIVSDEDARRVTVIKIDVEGAEPPILRNLLDHLSRFPKLRDVLVEASPTDNPGEWREIFARFRECGFEASTIPNEYSFRWYLKWNGPRRRTSLEALPQSQVDILFSRGQ